MVHATPHSSTAGVSCAAFPTGPTLLEEIILVAKAQRDISAAGAPVNLAQAPGADPPLFKLPLSFHLEAFYTNLRHFLLLLCLSLHPCQQLGPTTQLCSGFWAVPAASTEGDSREPDSTQPCCH